MASCPPAESPAAQYISSKDREFWNQSGASPPLASLTESPDRHELRFNRGILVIQVPRGEFTSWLEALGVELVELLNLSENWDSNGARAINERCVRSLLELLFEVSHPNTPPPAIVPTVFGGVQAEWHQKGLDLEIEVNSPNRFAVYCKDHKTNKVWEDDATTDFKPLASVLERLAD